MKSHIGPPRRALISAAAVATAVGLLTAAPAAAHVHVDAENPAPASTSVLTFQVPGESDTGALTTQLSVTLPDVASARTEVLPGWTAQLDRDTAAGTVRSVTWTAAPGVGISSDQFALFRISVKLPDADTVSFPTTQTYSDGTVVRWDQAPMPDGSEPEHPAPQLALSSSGAESPAAQGTTTADNSARWLAGGALVLAVIAAVVALAGRRRS